MRVERYNVWTQIVDATPPELRDLHALLVGLQDGVKALPEGLPPLLTPDNRFLSGLLPCGTTIVHAAPKWRAANANDSP